MIDSLIQYLLEEIAMDGDEGSSIHDLANFISDFYSSRSSSSSIPSTSASTSSATTTVQQVDDTFLTFIWNTLVEQPDVRVGLLKNLENQAEASTPALPTNDDNTQGEPQAGPSTSTSNDVIAPTSAEGGGGGGGDEEESDLKPAKKPARKKTVSNPSTTPTHELTLVPSETASLGYVHLSEVYSNQGELRVLASPQTAWKAITGSHSRPTSITPMVYQVLQMVSRGRGEGATAVRLSRELGVDPKSVFHYIKVPQQLGIVKKISAIDQGSRTNRIIHIRYLSTSPYWAVHTASEPTASRDDAADEEEAGGGGGGGGGEGQMSTISALYLSTNPKLVRNRIVRALKAQGDGTGKDLEKCWMVHSEMASSIGLHSYSSTILRRLNAIINGLAVEGVLEKIAVTKKNRKLTGKSKGQVESVSTVQALRLLDPDKLYKSKANRDDQEGEVAEEEEEDDEHSYPLANKSMQRQVLDLLLEADTRGLTNVEICDALGRYTLRTIDATLQRIGRQAAPVEYFDSNTTSLTETVGRMKQTRWFSMAGYVAMRRERGVPDSKAEEKWEEGKKAYEADVEKRRSQEMENRDGKHEQWLGIEERRKWLKRFKTMDHVGKGIGEKGVASKPRKRRASTKKTDKSDDDEDAQTPAGTEQEGGGGKKKPKKVAAPRKPKADSKGKGKAKAINQDETANDDEDQSKEGGGESSASETKGPPKPRGRPRKHALVEGKETYYQRKKRLEAERIAQGLEPEETYYSRKKREEKEDREREAAGLPPLVREKPKRGRSTVDQNKNEEDGDDELPEGSESPAPPKPKKRGRPSASKATSDSATPAPSKKRGRPSKLDKLAAAAEEELERSQSRSRPQPEDTPLEESPQIENQEEEEEEEMEPVEERPKKRTRFSIAAVEKDKEENNEKQEKEEESAPTPAPTQPARRRGRSSGPPLVPGPELDGAPVRTPVVNATPTTTEENVYSSTPAKTPPAPPRPSSPKKPVVEIPVRPRKEKRKQPSSTSFETPKTPAEAPASSTSTSRATPSPAEEPLAQELQAPVEPDSTPATAGDSLPGQAQVPELSPPPAHRTPSASKEKEKESNPSKKYKSRKSVTSKDNLTAISRQKEILEYITATGGIVDAVPRLGEFIRDHSRSANPSVPVFTMDRHVVNSTLTTLVKREHLRKTSVVGAKGDRYDIYYLNSITLDSPEMVSFLDESLSKKEMAHWDKFGRAKDIVIDDLTQTNSGETREGEEPSQAIAESDLPKPGDDPADVKDYFRRQPNIVGASYGARYGVFSRARQLHKWLASFLFSPDQPSQLVAHSDEHGFVLTHETFVSAMPVDIFTSIVPLPIESDELRKFLADPNNLSLSVRSVPSNILSILRPSLTKRKQAVWNAISTLMTFRLLSPLVVSTSESGAVRNNNFITPGQAKSATHWRFNKTVPVYAFAQEDAPLVSLAKLDSFEAVSQYWTTVHKLAVVLVEQLPVEDPAKLAQSGFPLKFEGFLSLLTRLRLKTRWKDTYHFLPDQRKFLVNLVQADPNLVNSNQDRSRDIEIWADALYAPVNVVTDFLRSTERKARRTIEAELNPVRRKKRRRVVRSDQGGGGGDQQGQGEGEEEWEEIEEDRPSIDVAATALHRKVQELAAQRKRDWTTIVDKFRAEHQQPVLDAAITSYLERRFLDPRRQIDAVQLLFELRQLLLKPEVVPGDESLRSVVPHNLRRLARQARDPYAIDRQPNIRKRVRSQASKAARAPATAPRPSSPQSIEHGDQNEFLSQPAAPRPSGEFGKRVRNFYTSEQDELLLDAVAILKARAQNLNTRIQYGVLEHLFKGHKGSVLRSRSLVLLKKPEEQAYHDRLVDAWLEIHGRLKDSDDNLQDPNSTSMTDFDIASFIRCLRQNVDKRALRLTRSIAKPPPPSVILPASLIALRTGYSIKSNASKRSTNWENYWVKAGVATAERENTVARASIATSWFDDNEEMFNNSKSAEAVKRDQALTAAAIKMVVSSSNDTYVPEQGAAMLSPFASHVDPVLSQLKSQHIIVSVSSEPGRRIPGRNYSFDDKFFDRLDSTRVTMERLSDAVQFENELLKEKQIDQANPFHESSNSVFPIIPTEGEIMALIDLASEGKIDLTIDTTTLSEKTKRFDDFGTRQANDDDIECNVQIEALSTRAPQTTPATLPVPETFLPIDGEIDLQALDAARKKFFANQDGEEMDLAREVLNAIESKGVDGMSLTQLCHRFPLSSRSTLLSSLSILLNAQSPPLIFTTGFSLYPTYVSTLHVPSYSIPLPLSKPITNSSNANDNEEQEQEQEKKWLQPCAWVGTTGEVNREVWTRCTNFVRGLLLRKSGIGFHGLREKSTSMNPFTSTSSTSATSSSTGGGEPSIHTPVLSTLELKIILETLEKHGIIERNSSSIGGGGEGTNRMVDWEKDRWSLNGCFWNVGSE
ncbi:uncharacterized protein JCM6883_000748 [Sporobolomyces salmoneus]|uniref:uncharacterized protein n=1 Tax=Sporobolomyces salmoneus TaxID=183962 RepID=UPI003178849D